MPRIKLFTVDEAERALPLVRRIVGDIARSFDERERRLIERQALPLHPKVGSKAEEQLFQLTREIELFEEELQRYVDELQQIGVELKDPRAGLIDFYSRYEERIVYLCWKKEEGDHLAWWHDLNAGFRGRQPITPGNRKRFKGLEPGQKYVELKI